MSPVPESGIPATMTEKHVRTLDMAAQLELASDLPWADDNATHLREIQSLVSALASRELVLVKREEIEALADTIQDASNAEAYRLMSDAMSRWLSAEPEEK